MGSPLGAAKYNSLLQGAASLDRLGTTDVNNACLGKRGITDQNPSSLRKPRFPEEAFLRFCEYHWRHRTICAH